MLTFYEYTKCSTCRMAKAELKALGQEIELIDIKENPPSIDTLKTWLAHSEIDFKQFFNTSGNSYRALGLKDKWLTLTVEEALSLLAADGMLIKRSILVKGDQVLQVGYRIPYEVLDL